MGLALLISALFLLATAIGIFWYESTKTTVTSGDHQDSLDPYIDPTPVHDIPNSNGDPEPETPHPIATPGGGPDIDPDDPVHDEPKISKQGRVSIGSSWGGSPSTLIRTLPDVRTMDTCINNCADEQRCKGVTLNTRIATCALYESGTMKPSSDNRGVEVTWISKSFND